MLPGNFKGSKICHVILWLIFGPGIFLASVGSPRVFLGFRFLSRFDHPCHLKSRVPPGVISFLFVYIFQFTKICEFTNFIIIGDYQKLWTKCINNVQKKSHNVKKYRSFCCSCTCSMQRKFQIQWLKDHPLLSYPI